jgi:hypothetical protein
MLKNLPSYIFVGNIDRICCHSVNPDSIGHTITDEIMDKKILSENNI